jgi:hypothetical protein
MANPEHIEILKQGADALKTGDNIPVKIEGLI